MKHRFFELAVISAAMLVLAAAEQTANAQGANLRVACAPDLQKFCPGLVKKDARQCLKAHRAELSAGCTAFFQEARARRMGTPPPGGPPTGGPPTGGPPAGGSPSAGPPPGEPQQ
jgi:hypothetical protein